MKSLSDVDEVDDGGRESEAVVSRGSGCWSASEGRESLVEA